MVEGVAERAPERTRRRTTIIDCDVHNSVPSDAALRPYLPARWRRYLDLVGHKGYHSLERGYAYPKISPGGGARVDAWPPSGGVPGSDLDFMREQLLDNYGIEIAVLNCLYRAGEQLNDEYADALATAINDWQVEEWTGRDSRLRASMVVPYEAGDLAAKEIERLAGTPGFVQVLVLPRTREPLGRRRYWPLYEAAEHYGIPVGIHFAGLTGNPITSSGWPSYYLEDHTVMAQAFQSQVISLIFEGVFERFPRLRVALVEGGFAWMVPLLWRLDDLYERLHEEVPHLRRRPSEYVREHMRMTTQPMEEPERPHHLLDLIEQLGPEMLMFSTDYPHWDFDDPNRAFQVRLPEEVKSKVFHENARGFYGF
ncbi:MAG: amidohydrolase family protein [Streptosporangiales bacterium]|nr:amidohydrolase family protein [Streptosporangiales bacterium]